MLITARRRCALPGELLRQLDGLAAGGCIYESAPVYFPHVGQPLITSSQEMVSMAAERKLSLGRLALEYEAESSAT